MWEYCQLYETEFGYSVVLFTIDKMTEIISGTIPGVLMAQLGVDGWELVTADKYNTYIFKRQKGIKNA